MPVVYIDVLLAINLLIDFLLLSATAYLLRLSVKRWRLVIGASAGAAASCVIFLPEMPPAISLALQLVIAALLTRIAFTWKNVRRYITTLSVFFGISLLFAGVAFGLWTTFAPTDMVVMNGVVYYDVPPLWLVAFSMISYGLLRLYDRMLRKKAPAEGIYRLRIDGGAGWVELNALYDTGHHVVEQFSRRPVIIVRYESLQSCLSSNLRHSLSQLLDGKEDDLSVHAALKSRIRMIPFHSMGGEGVLPAFQPVSILLSDRMGNAIQLTDVYIAVSRKLKSREYEALIGGEPIEQLTEAKGGNPNNDLCIIR